MKKSLKKSLVLILVAAAAIGGGAWVYRDQAAKSPEQRYKIQAVEKGDLTQTVSANGTLNPTIVVQVGTQVSGTVKKLYVDFNSKVEAGQKLVELDDAVLSAVAKQSAASVVSAAASLDLTTANEARMKSLLAQEYVSKQEYDQALQAKKAAQAALALARAQNERDRVNLDYAVIRSPVSGVVVDRVVDVGQTVAASFQTPTLIKIAQDLSKMQIDSAFAEADVGNIKVGQKVRFSVDAFPNRSFQGEVKQIRLNATNQQNVVTYDVVVAVDNPEQILLPGMTAYVNIGVARRQDVLLVPNAALRFKPADAAAANGAKAAEKSAGANGPGGAGGQAGMGGMGGGKGPGKKRDTASGTVYVLAGGEIKPVSVQLGITDNRSTEVVGGDLKPGDRVVTGDNVAVKAPSSVGMRMF